MIDPKLKEAWQWIDLHSGPGPESATRVLLNAYLDAEARARMAEFKLEHEDLSEYILCAICDGSDPRHTWDFAKWREEVEVELNA